jgi:hypothetical protein
MSVNSINEINLVQNALNKLTEENTSFFDRLFGNSRAANVNQLQKTVSDLAKTIINQPLSNRSAIAMGLPVVQGQYTAIAQEAEILTQRRVQDFYAALNTRLTDLNIHSNHPDFVIFFAAAIKLLENEVTLEGEKDPRHFSDISHYKLREALNQLEHQVFRDIIITYASQLLYKITPASYEEKVNQLNNIFRHTGRNAIEKVIKNSIHVHHKGKLEDHFDHQKIENAILHEKVKYSLICAAEDFGNIPNIKLNSVGIPVDILASVFSFLNTSKDFQTVSGVCRFWRKIMQSPQALTIRDEIKEREACNRIDLWVQPQGALTKTKK